MVQFLKWVIRFQVFSAYILAGFYHFLVADLISYPWFMPALPQLRDRCNTLLIQHLFGTFFKVELVLYLRLNQS